MTYTRGTDLIQDIQKSQMMVKFKVREWDDPFDDNPKNSFKRTGKAVDETFGQITHYATAHAAAQYRTHAFSALVFPKYMRLLRWDRNGFVVTERLSWDSEALYLFFKRFNHATPEARGVGTTVNTNPTLSHKSKTAIKDALRRQAGDKLISLDIKDNTYFACEKDIYAQIRNPIGCSMRTFTVCRKRD